jgi:hypothetical protein
MNGALFAVQYSSLIDHQASSFRAPEALFQPSFLGLEFAGIHETT